MGMHPPSQPLGCVAPCCSRSNVGPGGDAVAPHLADLHPSEHEELLLQVGVCERGEGGMSAMQGVAVCPDVSCAFFCCFFNRQDFFSAVHSFSLVLEKCLCYRTSDL